MEKVDNPEKIFLDNYEKVSDVLGTEFFFKDPDFINACTDLVLNKNLRKFPSKYVPFPILKKKIISSTEEIWDFLGLEPHEVLVLNKNDLLDKIIGFFINPERSDYQALFHSPLKIPLYTRLTRDLDASVNAISTYDESKIFYSSILIDASNNYIAKVAYNHELAHTQIRPDIKNCSCLNQETFPIFIEYLSSVITDETMATSKFFSNERIYSIAKNFSLLHLHDDISKEGIITNISYLIGTFQAYNLLDIYFSSSIQIKREMLGKFNKAINGVTSLEDVLDYYDSSFEQVQKEKIIKKLLV